MFPALRLFVLVLGLFAAAAALPALSPALADDPPETTLFLNLTTDETMAATMALSYADMVKEAGHPVVVFLNVRGVRIADKNFPPDRRQSGAKTPKDMLEMLMAKGVAVHVCPMCSENAGMSEDDWIDGVKRGGAEIIQIQMAPGTRVMSY
jgi:predicted peroxiredoxin